jgi:hypothetical protein
VFIIDNNSNLGED